MMTEITSLTWTRTEPTIGHTGGGEIDRGRTTEPYSATWVRRLDPIHDLTATWWPADARGLYAVIRISVYGAADRGSRYIEAEYACILCHDPDDPDGEDQIHSWVTHARIGNLTWRDADPARLEECLNNDIVETLNQFGIDDMTDVVWNETVAGEDTWALIGANP